MSIHLPHKLWQKDMCSKNGIFWHTNKNISYFKDVNNKDNLNNRVNNKKYSNQVKSESVISKNKRDVDPLKKIIKDVIHMISQKLTQDFKFHQKFVKKNKKVSLLKNLI